MSPYINSGMRFGVVVPPMLRNRVVCVLANHGLIDIIIHPSRIWMYAFAFTPTPQIAWLIAFVPASVLHFGRDLGLYGSVWLHAMLAACAVTGNVAFAETCLFVFMMCVHIPCVLLRLKSVAHIICMCALIVSGLFQYSLVDPENAISSLNVRIVTMHCWLGMI